MQTRQATIADLDQLVPLFDAYRQFYGQQTDAEAARRFLSARFKNNQSLIFLAISASGDAVGFVQLFPSFSSVSMMRTERYASPCPRPSITAAPKPCMSPRDGSKMRHLMYFSSRCSASHLIKQMRHPRSRARCHRRRRCGIQNTC